MKAESSTKIPTNDSVILLYLISLLLDNTLIPDLDNNIPKDVEEAYLIQDQVVKSFNYNQIGWKVGCTTEMAQKFSGMTEPFSGIMFQETTFLSPNLDVKSYMNKPIIEPEPVSYTHLTLPTNREV